jgi:hypothetical protein
MLAWACLDRPLPAAQTLLLADGVLALVAVLALLAAAISAIAVPFVQRSYRRRVVRLMGFEQVAPRPSAWWELGAAAAAQRTRPADATTTAGTDTPRLAQQLEQCELRITVSTALAWLVFAIASLAVAHWTLPAQAASDKAYFAVAAGLLALGPLGINLPRRLALRTLLPALAVGAAALALVALFADAAPAAALSTNAADDPDVLDFVIGASAIGLAYGAVLHRGLRGLLIPVSFVTTLFALLMVIPIAYLEPHLGSCITESTSSVASADDMAMHVAMFSLFATTSALAAWLALKALDALARAVEAGWLSELSLCCLVVLAMVAALMVGGNLIDQPGHSSWVAWMPLPWVTLPVLVYAAFISRQRRRGPGPRLLVLRVFARKSKQRKLLDALQSRWRYAGPVHQIGGPDLAALNVDPYECALFITGRLHDVFLPQAASAEQLSARLAAAADREGRYRISEVFCFNSAWRTTVEQLMHLSDAILLDLRGFSAQREGTGYELNVLARTGLIERVVAVGDVSTDWLHVERLLAEEGEDPRRLARCDAGCATAAEAIFDRLLAVAAKSSLGTTARQATVTTAATPPA